MAYEKLPDTHWHVGYVTKAEDDPRRHKARCVKYNKGECGFHSSRTRCQGSSHCSLYAETLEDWQKNFINTRTNEELAELRKDAYLVQMIEKRKRFEVEYNGPMKNNPVAAIKICPVCGENLKTGKNDVMANCRYCKAVICDEDASHKVYYPVIIVGRGKKRPETGNKYKKKIIVTTNKTMTVKDKK